MVAACSSPTCDAAPSPAPTAPTVDAGVDPSSVTSTTVRVGRAPVAHTVATGLDVPWGIAVLPTGRPWSRCARRRGSCTSLRAGARSPAGSRPVPTSRADGTVPGVVPAGEGGLLGIALSPAFATDHLLYAYFTAASRQPDRADDATSTVGSRRRRSSSAGIPKGVDPQRRPDRLRPGRHALRRHRRGRRPSTRRRTGKSWAARSCGSPPTGGSRAGQPLPGLARLDLRPPQRPGPGLGLAGPDVRQRVRPGHLGRAQPDRRGRQLRLAGRRGHRARAGFTDPLRQWPTEPGVAERDRDRRRRRLHGRAARRAAVANPVDGQRHRDAARRSSSAPTAGCERWRAAPDGGLWLLTDNTVRGTPRPGDDQPGRGAAPSLTQR